MPPSSIAYRRKARCKIIVDGDDVTSKLNPHLISVQVIDKKTELDTCVIELDDRDGRLAIPANRAQIQILLGWDPRGPTIPPVPPPPFTVGRGNLPNVGGSQLPWEGSMTIVFQGMVDSVESGFARRGGGRRLWIEGLGGDLYQYGKTPFERHWGEGAKEDTDGSGEGSGGGVTLKEVMDKAAEKTGYQMKMSSEIAQIKRDYWHQHESFHNLGMRLAKEIGADFKVAGNVATMVSSVDGTSASGQAMATVEAYWGVNLLAWRIKPYVGRPQYNQARSTWFDSVNGKWKETIKELTGVEGFAGVAKALTQLPSAAPNRQVGSQITTNADAEVQINRGTGWVLLNGEPAALANGTVVIVGAREGVDGRYLILEAEHNYSRASGYTTRCILGKPESIGIIHGDPMGQQ